MIISGITSITKCAVDNDEMDLLTIHLRIQTCIKHKTPTILLKRVPLYANLYPCMSSFLSNMCFYKYSVGVNWTPEKGKGSKISRWKGHC